MFTSAAQQVRGRSMPRSMLMLVLLQVPNYDGYVLIAETYFRHARAITTSTALIPEKRSSIAQVHLLDTINTVVMNVVKDFDRSSVGCFE